MLRTYQSGRTENGQGPRTTDHGPRTTDHGPRKNSASGLSASGATWICGLLSVSEGEAERIWSERLRSVLPGREVVDLFICQDLKRAVHRFKLEPGYLVIEVLGQAVDLREQIVRVVDDPLGG